MAIDWWNLSREYVDRMYRENLGRDADEGGREYWVQQLANGSITPDQLGERLRGTEITPFSMSLQDASYAAFLRGADVEESAIESAMASARDRRDQTLAIGRPQYDDQRKKALQAASTDWENRGLFRAGGRLVDEADRTTAIDRQQAVWEQGLANEFGDRQSQATQQTAALRRRRLEEESLARQRLTLRDAETAAMKLGG